MRLIQVGAHLRLTMSTSDMCVQMLHMLTELGANVSPRNSELVEILKLERRRQRYRVNVGFGSA